MILDRFMAKLTKNEADLKKIRRRDELYKVFFSYVSYGGYPDRTERDKKIDKVLKEIREEGLESVYVTDIMMDLHLLENGNPGRFTRDEAIDKARNYGVYLREES